MMAFAAEGECDSERPGYPRSVSGAALLLSVHMARVCQFLRYFRSKFDNAPTLSAEPDDEVENATCAQEDLDVAHTRTFGRTTVQRLNAATWDPQPDKPSHPDYDYVFSTLLPGERLIQNPSTMGQGERGPGDFGVFRRVRNGDVAFPRFL